VKFIASSFCAGNGSCVEAASTSFASSSASGANGSCVEAGSALFAASSASNSGHCVEAAAAEFASAAASGQSTNCVETGAHADGVIFLRDSKDAEGGDFPHLHYTPEEWDGGRGVTFVPVLRADVPARLKAAALLRGHEPQDWHSVTRPGETAVLYFDQAEVDAWRQGVENSEFRLTAAGATA
jgi:Domain of unknown function (DUF397)